MSMCNVLAVLSDDRNQIRETFNTAVELADAENARLTLAKTCEYGKSYVWISPFGVGGAYLPEPSDSPETAAGLLARVAEFVPSWIPVTTMVLEHSTQRSLMKLLCDGHYGAVVADAKLFPRCRRLRRRLEHDQILAVPVKPGSRGRSALEAALQSNAVTQADQTWRSRVLSVPRLDLPLVADA
jgi:hypothetical protein